MKRRLTVWTTLAVVIFCFTVVGFAQVVKDPGSMLDTFAYRDFNLGVKSYPVEYQMVQDKLPNADAWKAFIRQNGFTWDVYIDLYTGMVSNANGPGLAWLADGQSLPSYKLDILGKNFITQNSGVFDAFPVDYLQLNEGRSGSFGENNYLTFIDYDVVYHGVPIQGARFVFRCNHGNMVQFGTEGVLPDRFVDLDPEPNLTAQEAQQAAFDYAGGFNPKTDTLIQPGRLFFMPRALVDKPTKIGMINVDYPLVWEVTFNRKNESGTWTAHVDAHTGQILEFYDDNAYGYVKGGVFEESPSISSEEETPMPFADYGNNIYANSCGVFSGTSGTTALNGKYVTIDDQCGSISRSASGGVIDLGTSSGTDCTTPATGGNGNTHAARSCFYHVNRTAEKVRGWLPNNTWLTQKLTAKVNIDQTCNAYWDGSKLNFFKSGGGCSNTGEIAAIFLHEWGHGLDSNDGNGMTSDMSTAEAYADSNAFLQTHNSCIGPGFLTSNCSGYGDSCTACTGVRDVDYARHSSGNPATPGNFVKNDCPSSYDYAGPCGKEGHCESMVLSETLWDLGNRDLPNMGYDSATSFYLLERLYYLSRPTSGQGYTCSNYVGSGCSSSNWHQTFLVVDDDDGNLTNGTPHAGAIKNAFARHGLSCSSSTSTNHAAYATPGTPSISATAGDDQVALSWSGVSNASKYRVLRNDFGCDKGFNLVAETSSTSYTDTTVANDFTYYYRVVAIGSSGATLSALSNCKTVTPTGGGGGTTYAISGTITASGAGISGVTVNYSGSASGSTTTASNGTYSISGLSNGSYTITPSKSGYSFSPTSQSKTISDNNISGVDFTGTAQSTDVQLTNGVGVNSSVAQGEMKFFYITVPSGATNLTFKTTNASADVDLYTRYDAKPTSSTYECRPYSSSGNETCSKDNPTAGTWWAGVNGYAAGSFTITATITTASATYTISGTVSGDTQSGVTINLTGTASSSTTTDGSGNYNFSGLANGSYTVTPSESGYTFTPTSRSVSINGANQTGQNFTAAAQSSGDVALSNGVGYNDTMNASTRQGTWKYYSFTVASGSANLTVSLSNLSNDLDLYTRQGSKPTSSSYACRPYEGGTTTETCTESSPAAGTWWVGINNWDTGTSMSYTITASWTEGGGGDTTPPDTQMTSSQCGTTITVDTTTFTWTGTDNVTATGNLVYSYRIDSGTWSSYSSATSKQYTGLSNATHTFEVKAKDEAGNIDPSPATCSVTVNVPSATYSISGTVSGDTASSVTINLTGAASSSTTTDGSGNYSFTGLSNGSYTVTPSKSGYTFSPTSRNVTISDANQTGQNFTATAVSGDTQLADGVPVSGSVAYQTYDYYYITVPSGATALTVDLYNLSDDADLYTKSGAKPTTSTYDGRSWNSGTTAEQIVHNDPSAGTWWIGVYGYAAASYTVKATITTASATYSISGTVSGDTASGVTINLTGAASSSTTTDASGNYSFSGLSNGSYTVTPSKSGYTFSPTSRSVTISGANQTGQNFTATITTGSCVAETAVYNSTYGAPACTTAGISCDASSSLLGCAGDDESNQPNTADTCTDGTSGTCGSDESVESLKIETTDGTSCLTTGQEVKVTFSVHCYSTEDYVALYYATDASAPSWTTIGSIQCDAAGDKTYTATFNLSGSAGSTQAVRAQIQYNTTTDNACVTGSYNDHDDLVFKTNGSALWSDRILKSGGILR